MDFSFNLAYRKIKEKWYGSIIAYFIILIVLYLGIWTIIEPLDINSGFKINKLNEIFNNRVGFHILICLILAPYITLAFLTLHEYRRKVNNFTFTDSEMLYNGLKPNNLDFEFGNKQRWSNEKKMNYGEMGKGSLSITNDYISLERLNNDGACFIDLFNYKLDKSKSKFIRKDLSKGGNREIQINFQIKLSGKGEQSVFWILKNYHNSVWFNSKKIVIDNNDWIPFNIFFKITFDKDFYLRIESADVSHPTSSIQIKNLIIYENKMSKELEA